MPLSDNSALFGSASGKLRGFIDMAALSRYSLDAQDPGFELVLRTLGHEVLHQWAAFTRFRHPDGTLNQ